MKSLRLSGFALGLFYAASLVGAAADSSPSVPASSPGAPAPVSAASPAPAAPVVVSEDATAFTLSNGIITARVSKRNGDLLGLQYKGQETLAFNSGHGGGYWSHDPTGGVALITNITVNPASNNGDFAEVSVKGVSGGNKMGHGPGAGTGGDFPADIEIRYALGRGAAGVYTYCIFDHRPEYPAATMTEARYCAKLADIFDWMYLDDKRNLAYSAEQEINDDKYNYTAVQFDHPAYGWASTKGQLGIWLVNPSMEYLSGGPTKVEFLSHRDTTTVAAPCLHNYWRSSHYGGAVVDVAEGESWTKIIGPFMLYVNTGGGPKALYDDAMKLAARESARWPYDWVAGVDYPRKEQRATVSGQLVLKDTQASTTALPHLLVGLAAPAYQVARAAANNTPNQIDWQTDAKHYEFWAYGDAGGKFAIPNVRPGTYTLHAFADGVLGEFARADVTVEPGKALDLGSLAWTPVRRGKQIWEVGVPNRNGSEFLKGDDFNHDGMALVYRDLFPNDVNFVVGKSDPAKDWFFQHVPHVEDPNARPSSILGANSNGRATPWTISFDLPAAPQGTATLRFALCASSARSIGLALNDQDLGPLNRLAGDSTIGRNGIQGIWIEREIPFDASLLKAGANRLTLTVPPGSATSGIIYDYIRLEVDESARPAAPASRPN